MKPLAKFRVHPENRALYYTVFVWRTLLEFREANPGNSHALGLCRSWIRLRCVKQANRMLSECGEVHLCRFHLRIGIIVHEFTHAVIGWAARIRCLPDFTPIQERQAGRFEKNDPDERFCHALGEMVRQCVHQLYRRKILK